MIDVAIILMMSSLAGMALTPLFLRSEGLLAASFSFATGTLLAIVMGHVIPEAVSHGQGGMVWLMGGFFLMMGLNHYLFRADPCCDHQHHEEHGHGHSHVHAGHETHAALPPHGLHEQRLSLTMVGAMLLCSLNDGFLMGRLVPDVGSSVLWGMVAHKLTASFGLFTILKIYGGPRRASGILLMMLFVLLTPMVYFATARGMLGEAAWLGTAEAMSGGVLLYVVMVNFIPRCNEMGHARGPLVIVMMLLGLATALGIGSMTPSHDHGPSPDEGHVHGPECTHGH
ncbi:MAG: hypothetical protein AB7F75_10760 [Planctomycetota bacterium]